MLLLCFLIWRLSDNLLDISAPTLGLGLCIKVFLIECLVMVFRAAEG